MNYRQANAWISQEFAKYPDCKGWRVWWVTTTHHHAAVRYSSKLLKLSKPVFKLSNIWEFQDNVLHEIAHVLTGPGNGHNEEWAANCKVTGALPLVTASWHIADMQNGRCAVAICKLPKREHRSAANRARWDCFSTREEWWQHIQATGNSEGDQVTPT